ncbi:MAG: bifunctional UDP-N-acetylglucosamine diphosphorylase/glucosamine-1-phosphate N-acetyltransferase GlmU [Oscillospiraceae bacterium]|jgi:bifunctional UDP-N-acetylglucosamine pyrophosphorylase/glucosamine-1-phosphate N-acetyltransferase|nr:bifunctional UDP-N-acetylglucosamine diphosphorylase/glucosamine-1-phosphate N-acetyltransferase GlmU [Oscillospiraceae bacterium]
MDNVCAVIMAAGDGTRMKSSYPKVLCDVLFKPMITWVTDHVADAGIRDACVVVREKEDRIAPLLPRGFITATQSADKNKGYGTGYAVMMAADFIKNGGFSDVVVLSGDAPFTGAQDILEAFEKHKSDGNDVTVLTSMLKDPAGYGRIVRDGEGVAAIVEQADADEDTKLIGEINSGTYWFKAAFLLDALGNITSDNTKGEYYLTDTVAYAVETGRKAGACVVSPDVVLGANDRKGLSELNRLALDKVLDRLMADGVNIPFPDGIVIGADVEIGPDTTILPGTVIRGRTVIGAGCEIGPNSYLDNAAIGDGCRVISSYVDSSTLENGVKIGPMSNIRPGCHIKPGVKIGDFVEIKNSTVGDGTAVAHLTYVGDADVGKNCNFGCGVVTSNYDGSKKYRTVIGDDVFIGGNTNLVAPVKLGNRVYSAAGTTVTDDVPDGALVIGRARQTVKEGWAERTGKYPKKT